MKYSFGFTVTLFLFFTNGLFGQNTNSHYKIAFTDTNHFTIVIDSIYINIPEKPTIVLNGKDSIIVIDSFNISRSPIEFNDVYIISLSKKPPHITNLTIKNHKVHIYYFDLNSKMLYPLDESSKAYLKTKNKTRQQLSTEVKNNKSKKHNLIIYSVEKNTANSIKLLKTFFSKLPLLYAMVNTGVENKTKFCSIIPGECFWDTTKNSNVDIERTENYYNHFSKINCYLSYNKPRRKVSDVLIINDHSIIKIPFTVNPPKNKKNNYLINANELVKKGEYIKAFNYISVNGSKIKPKRIIVFYNENYKSGLEQAYKEKKLLEYLDFSENNWKVDTISALDYSSLKRDYLIKTYKQLNAANSDPKLKLLYLEKIVALAPKTNSYKVDLLNLKGDIALEHKNYSDAINYYIKSYQISKSEFRLKKIKSLLVLTTKNNCLKNRRDYLWKNYRIFEKNKQYWKNSYVLNYYAACTYYNLAYYKNAYTSYLWMRQHFQETNKQNQRLISLQKLDKKIYNLLLKTGKYYQACKASQTLCYNSNNPSIVQAEMKVYLASYKGAWFSIISDAIKTFLSNGNSVDKLISNINQNKTNLLSDNKIESILVYYPSKGTQRVIKGRENKTLNIMLNHLNSFPVVTNDLTKDKNLFFLVDRNGKKDKDPLVVISYRSISKDNNEMELIQFLQNKKDITNTWTEINDFEQKSIEKVVVPWLASIIQTDKASQKNTLNAYWNVIKKHSFIVYILLFDENGNEFYNRGFEPNLFSIEEMMWEKSKTTPLFFRQQLKIKSNNQLYINDISIPIIINNSKNVLKLGIKPLCN